MPAAASGAQADAMRSRGGLIPPQPCCRDAGATESALAALSSSRTTENEYTAKRRSIIGCCRLPGDDGFGR